MAEHEHQLVERIMAIGPAAVLVCNRTVWDVACRELRSAELPLLQDTALAHPCSGPARFVGEVRRILGAYPFTALLVGRA